MKFLFGRIIFLWYLTDKQELKGYNSSLIKWIVAPGQWDEQPLAPLKPAFNNKLCKIAQ